MNTNDLYDESIDLATRIDNAAETIGQLQTEVEEYHKLTAETNAVRFREQAERQRLRRLLEISFPYVESQAEAEHMLDGFRPQTRPLDKVVEEIRQALFMQETV